MFIFIFYLVSGTDYILEKTNNQIYLIHDNNTLLNMTDQQAIQSTIDLPESETVHLRSGTYYLSTNLFLKENIHLTGDGIDKTILKLEDFAPSFIVGTRRKSGLLRASFKNNITVSNLTLDGNKNNQYTDENHSYGRFGLFTEACDDVLFDYVKIINFQGYGFDPHGKKGDEYFWANNLTITNCIAENNTWDGFALDQTFNIEVDNCTAINNGRHGFNIITGSKYVVVKNSIAIDNGYYDPYGGSGCGIMIQNNHYLNTSYVSLENNYLENSKKAGICLNDVSNVYASENKIVKSCTCFELIDSSESEIIDNKCRTNRLNRTENSDIETDDNNYKHRSCYKSNAFRTNRASFYIFLFLILRINIF